MDGGRHFQAHTLAPHPTSGHLCRREQERVEARTSHHFVSQKRCGTLAPAIENGGKDQLSLRVAEAMWYPDAANLSTTVSRRHAH